MLSTYLVSRAIGDILERDCFSFRPLSFANSSLLRSGFGRAEVQQHGQAQHQQRGDDDDVDQHEVAERQ